MTAWPSIVYPDSLPCAQIKPYSITVDMGLVRTAMEGGHMRQRRMYRTMPHAFALEFIMTPVDLGAWQEWVNVNAYDYFLMPKLESMYSGKLFEIASPHSIRFTGNLAIENVVYGWVRVRVTAELDPLHDALTGPFAPTGDWIIAGTPPMPSADSVIAGRAAAPAVDDVHAGTPGRPSAVVE